MHFKRKRIALDKKWLCFVAVNNSFGLQEPAEEKKGNEGKTLREIGKIVGRTHSSIQRVINNYTSSKSVISKPRSGRPSKLTAREKRCLQVRTFESTYKCLSDCK
ncbi:hypothetical protein CDAR_189791 [Caerostris darwini]|uniref:Tc3 transposase DNA binding domain-containing protein n=1 Tax=Caerostris darwini TaxID=1538125 RepID=A0AAV4VLI6_9ARAC|nr:hypothetical protein CDAR_189791 [Caerostris darwini]